MLLCDDNIVKICDFGLAKDVYKYQEYQKKTDVSIEMAVSAVAAGSEIWVG